MFEYLQILEYSNDISIFFLTADGFLTYYQKNTDLFDFLKEPFKNLTNLNNFWMWTWIFHSVVSNLFIRTFGEISNFNVLIHLF